MRRNELRRWWIREKYVASHLALPLNLMMSLVAEADAEDSKSMLGDSTV